MSADPCEAIAAVAQHLASRITAGAALWVTAPGLEDHARHFAVEFVHPASVGAAAVPATAVTGTADDIFLSLRRHARPNDVVVSLGSEESGFAHELSVRSLAWGVDHVHIGWSCDQAASQLNPSTFRIWLGSSDDAEHLVTRTYHLLWELTFICMQMNRRVHERPGSAPLPAADERTGGSCPVCSDEAMVCEVQAPTVDHLATVRNACGTQVIDVSLLDNVRTYDLVLAHAGTAIRHLTVGNRS